ALISYTLMSPQPSPCLSLGRLFFPASFFPYLLLFDWYGCSYGSPLNTALSAQIFFTAIESFVIVRQQSVSQPSFTKERPTRVWRSSVQGSSHRAQDGRNLR